MSKTIHIVLLLVALFCLPVNLHAIDPIRIIASDGEHTDFFGFSTDISGDYAIIGASQARGIRQNSGAAYIFHFDGEDWIEQAKLISVAGSFGYAVSIDGNIAAVGARTTRTGDHFSVGSVHVFERDGDEWEETYYFMPEDLDDHRWFGSSVAVSGDKFAVGYPRQPNGGGVYTFTKVDGDWQLEDVLNPEEDVPGAQIGYNLEYDGRMIFAGAPYHEQGELTDGAAYVFTNDEGEWHEDLIIKSEDLKEEFNFGFTISLNGDYAAISDGYYNEEHYLLSVNMYEHVNEEWELTQTIDEHDDDNWFGREIALTNDMLLVSAYEAVYGYRKIDDRWQEFETDITYDYPQIKIDNIAMDGRWVIIGDKSAEVDTISPGAAYIYDISE